MSSTQVCESDTLRVELDEEHGDVLIAHVHGPLDLSTAPALDRTFQEYLDTSTTRHLLLDLSDVSFLGCRGVAVLVRLAHWATAHAGCDQPCLIGLSTCARRMLELVEVMDMFSVHDTLASALAGQGTTCRIGRTDRRPHDGAAYGAGAT